MLFQQPGFRGAYTIDDVVTAQENGEKIAIFSMSIKSKRGIANFVLRLLPDYAWALQEVVYTSSPIDEEQGERDYEKIHCEYHKNSQGMPRLHEMLREGGFKQKDGTIRLINRDKYTVESFTAGPADISKFDVERLVGNKIGVQRALLNLRIAGIALGVLLLVLSHYLYLRRKKSKEETGAGREKARAGRADY